MAALVDLKRGHEEALRDDPTQSIPSIGKTLGIARTTFYRYTKGKSPEPGYAT